MEFFEGLNHKKAQLYIHVLVHIYVDALLFVVQVI